MEANAFRAEIRELYKAPGNRQHRLVSLLESLHIHAGENKGILLAWEALPEVNSELWDYTKGVIESDDTWASLPEFIGEIPKDEFRVNLNDLFQYVLEGVEKPVLDPSRSS